jgi:hypothetical protein
MAMPPVDAPRFGAASMMLHHSKPGGKTQGRR